MEIEEDQTLRKPTVIIERKFHYDTKSKIWTWYSPRIIKYRKPIINEHIKIIEKLLASEELHNENIASLIQAKNPDLYSKDNKFWEPTDLEVGQTYLVFSKLGCKWLRAKLVAIEDETLHLVKERTLTPVTVNHRKVAHAQPVAEFLKVGTRVIGLVHRISSTGELFRGQRVHEMGLVAESPCAENKYRYLLVLDDGWWTYVPYTSIWPLCYQPPKAWNLLPKQTKTHEYFNGLYTSMVDYQKGDTIRCVVDGVLIDRGLVLKVDASIVIFWSNFYSTAISIYRGFPHLTK